MHGTTMRINAVQSHLKTASLNNALAITYKSLRILISSCHVTKDSCKLGTYQPGHIPSHSTRPTASLHPPVRQKISPETSALECYYIMSRWYSKQSLPFLWSWCRIPIALEYSNGVLTHWHLRSFLLLSLSYWGFWFNDTPTIIPQ
jgi:hypothetical protein